MSFSYQYASGFANYPINSAASADAAATVNAYSPHNINGFFSSPINSGVTATGIFNPDGAAYPIYSPYINPYLDALLNPDGQKLSTQQPTAEGVRYSPVAPETIDYLNAEIAKHYGMSKETAYQEALANTSYQRAMKDMQAAGLNPAAIFGAGKGSGADGVSYVSSGTTGSGRFGATTAKANEKANLFSEGAYYGLSAAIGLVGALLLKSPTGYWIGNSVAQGALGAANAGYKSRHR